MHLYGLWVVGNSIMVLGWHWALAAFGFLVELNTIHLQRMYILYMPLRLTPRGKKSWP
ncbi:uncharacterized protein BDR25DRAFT_364011 [Lindgomyces ingoldianus]|uniref:Uncharacterized protein n=1 Tax=Lindgomyces ingoldianus TaxID=673940 RepID=A0ACB6Q6D7_9PLEO|nr:uncharacterized protein BDR25DRAFT_364011 [Lindgomyces ingoldianus]KAF2462509.1 hypothetical protein BDR25DRAFT_364011 [Lindgomyces ingoldianus]